MVPLALADELEISHAAGGKITLACSDPELPVGSDNLCVRAARAFLEATGLERGIAISLLKRIPHGAGLGGGSSDAAAVLKALNELFDHPLVFEELLQLASGLGSDIPFFLGAGPAWCRGRGEILESHTVLPSRRLLLIKPPFPVPTAWAYHRYAELVSSRAGVVPDAGQHLESIPIVNDLEVPVFEKYLLLPAMKNWLREQPDVESAFMSGSGSTMVAIMHANTSANSIEALKEKIKAEFGPTLWITETCFRFEPGSAVP